MGYEASVEVLLATRACLAVLLLAAAAGKLAHQRDFTAGVINYQVLPIGVARLVARVLPAIELALGLALLLGVALPLTGGLTAALFAIFIAAVVINLTRGRRIGCNCYGIAGTVTISWGTVARNGMLLVFALIVAGQGIAVPSSLWMTPWSSHGSLDVSTSQLLISALLLAWCLVLVHLVEWTVDIHLRLSGPRTTSDS